MTAEAFESLQQLLSGQYVLERELGRGGMGVVFLAKEVRLDRLVAVKVLPPELGLNPELRERFLREARTAAQLSHPNIVPIFRADEIGGYAFFTMAFVDGESLADRVRARGSLPPADAVRVLREAAWALAYAHARGVVHRDVKPENIMIERGSNRAVVTDFGIARDQLASSLTQEGFVLGSAHYMSPEQAAGDKLDGRSDLYSLGVVGFEVLSGRRPFDAEGAASVMAQQVTRPAPSILSLVPNLPRALAGVIDRCLAKNPDDRYPTGEALADALQAALDAAPVAIRGDSGQEFVATEQAHAIWLRAAQLQAEAATRLQARYGEFGLSNTAAAALPSGGYRLHDVELAASEAGIAHEFVAMAVAERPAGTAIFKSSESSSREERTLTRMLGTRDRSISHSRVVRASPKAVLETIGRIFTVHPFSLTLRETVGGHPLDGGIMVFDVPMFRSGQSVVNDSAGVGSLGYRMTQIEVKQLNVVLKPVGSPADACEITISGDLRRGMRKNWTIDKFVSIAAALGGAASGGAIGISALSLGAIASAPALAGAGLLGGASLVTYRWVYRYALRKSYTELEGMISAVERDLRAASVFGAPPPPNVALRRPQQSEDSMVIIA